MNRQPRAGVGLRRVYVRRDDGRREALVQLQPDELSSPSGRLLLQSRSASTDRLAVALIAQCWLLVDAGAVVVDMSERRRREGEGHVRRMEEAVLTYV